MSLIPHVAISVQDVALSILKSNPPQLSITAVGLVPTAKFAYQSLVPYVYITAPLDGIYDFTFISTHESNSGDHQECIVHPVVAYHVLQVIPNSLKGVRVHGSINSSVALLISDSSLKEVDLTPLSGSGGVAT